jgi:hypothetical protein
MTKVFPAQEKDMWCLFTNSIWSYRNLYADHNDIYTFDGFCPFPPQILHTKIHKHVSEHQAPRQHMPTGPTRVYDEFRDVIGTPGMPVASSRIPNLYTPAPETLPQGTLSRPMTPREYTHI